MKALTLTQPYATLVAHGYKRFETRAWGTDHRGPLAIHAARSLEGVGGKAAFVELCGLTPFREALGAAGYRQAFDLPRGRVLALVMLAEVLPTESAVVRYVIEGTDEEAFGDYSRGRKAWRFDAVAALRVPIVCSGSLGLWELPPAAAVQLP